MLPVTVSRRKWLYGKTGSCWAHARRTCQPSQWPQISPWWPVCEPEMEVDDSFVAASFISGLPSARMWTVSQTHWTAPNGRPFCMPSGLCNRLLVAFGHDNSHWSWATNMNGIYAESNAAVCITKSTSKQCTPGSHASCPADNPIATRLGTWGSLSRMYHRTQSPSQWTKGWNVAWTKQIS